MNTFYVSDELQGKSHKFKHQQRRKVLFQMKIKHAIILLVTGYCLDFIGGLFKIMHYPNGDLLLLLATIIKISGALVLLYKVLTHPKLKDFLNW